MNKRDFLALLSYYSCSAFFRSPDNFINVCLGIYKPLNVTQQITELPLTVLGTESALKELLTDQCIVSLLLTFSCAYESLVILLKCIFCFSRSGAGPQSLHFSGGWQYCWSQHFEEQSILAHFIMSLHTGRWLCQYTESLANSFSMYKLSSGLAIPKGIQIPEGTPPSTGNLKAGRFTLQFCWGVEGTKGWMQSGCWREIRHFHTWHG